MLYAAFVSIVYVTGLFVVEPHILNHSESQVALLGNQTGSFMALVDGLGHTYMCLAVCMTAPVFAGGRLATWTRWIAIASGPTALMILAFYVAQRIPLGIPGDSPRPGLGRPGRDLLLQGWSSDVMAQTTAATQQVIAASEGAARRAAPKLKAWMGFWSGPPTSMSTAVMESEVEIKRRPAEVFDYCGDHTHERIIKMKHVEKVTGRWLSACGTRWSSAPAVPTFRLSRYAQTAVRRLRAHTREDTIEVTTSVPKPDALLP